MRTFQESQKPKLKRTSAMRGQWIVLLACVIGVSACGGCGGGSSTSSEINTPPPPASGLPIAVIAVDVGIPLDSTTQAILPFVDGVTLYLNWAGQPFPTDTTTCTTAPCKQTSDFTSLDAAIAGYTSATCGASLRGKGSACIVNLSFQPITGLLNYNGETPAWVFSQAWATTVGSPVQDAAFCSEYPQNASAIPLPPATGTANITTTNCGPSGTPTQCTAATVATGVPAIWEQPYVAAINNWHQAIIQ